MTPPKSDSRPKRTPIAHYADYAHVLVPHYLDYPPEIEQETEAMRVAAKNVEAARQVSRDADRRHTEAVTHDRLAAAQASPEAVAPKAPAMKAALVAAHDAERAALDAASIAMKRQLRAITPDVARDWRARNDPQAVQVSEEIRVKLRELGDLIATRDTLILLDETLERTERGEALRISVSRPDVEQRRIEKETDKMRRVQQSGGRPASVPNGVPSLLAALTCDADRWEEQKEAKRQRERVGEIVREVRAERRDSASRVNEIRRRLIAENIPVPRKIGLL